MAETKQEKPKIIEAIAKADAGYHPDFGRIVKGRAYQVPERPFPDQLFTRPAAPEQVRDGSRVKK
ncbi:hypothetical protein [Desulfuromonas sp. TF]|uniref:hypothetical protein n=1 Tax=Desulfuromonas sp. TF TaxID=1232410 RepID=UPI0003F77F79|nr:hypothetical protein [Desulfuromonas sp. TF]